MLKQDRYGEFGGCYVPELLVAPLQDLEDAFLEVCANLTFRYTLEILLKNYAGRPTPITDAIRLSRAINGPKIYLKREDLLHTGAHKLNNALGQCLLAKHMGKTRVIAETGAGQHGVATAAACAHLDLDCVVYMGSHDIKRQSPNVTRMTMMGAEVVPVNTGSATLKDAVNAALRDWAHSFADTHYCIGSALGPYPYPQVVAHFQSVIGEECKQQIKPDMVIACVGGGSNAIGIFSAFLDDPRVRLIGVEAGGYGDDLGQHAARLKESRTPGVLHGCYTYVLQDDQGQIAETASIAAGLDYPAIGPQHAQLFLENRAQYFFVCDDEAIAAQQLLAKTEGIIPALESAHALAYLIKIAPTLNKDLVVLVNLSGRGDKDLARDDMKNAGEL